MANVPQPRVAAGHPDAPQWPALTAVLDRADSAQSRAVRAWHQNTVICQIDQALTDNPSWPLIDCNDQPRAFAPARGAPAPAGAA